MVHRRSNRRRRRTRATSLAIVAQQGSIWLNWLIVASAIAGCWIVATRPLLPTRPAFRTTRQPVSAAQARRINAARPFAAEPVRAATPFTFRGSPAAREQAVRCLATAALYEAGTDERGQRAVMQVGLNRVRDRAFPRTICGVVYEGAYRATGCQFSFACDHSVERRPQTIGWPQALRNARGAVAGRVFAPVGTATHYHTDWVVPAWSGSLEKIAKVRSHIFYRAHATRAHAGMTVS